MRKEDWQRFQTLMREADVLTVMPNGKDLEDMTTALFAALGPYPVEAVEDAVWDHCRKCRFFPMLADIVTRIEGQAEERALLAWMMLKKAERRYGLTRSFRFPNPAVQFTVEALGGWRKLYLRGLDAPNVERDFMRLYGIAERRGVTWGDVESQYNQGDLERTARILKYPELPPVYDAATDRPLLPQALEVTA